MADRLQMPSSTAGITRYFDDYKSKIEIRPGYVILMAVFVMILIMLLHVYGNALFGVPA